MSKFIKSISNFVHHIGHTRFALNSINKKVDSILPKLSELNSLCHVRYLQDKVVNCTNSGITSDTICEQEVVVSLTTYGKRIYDVHLAIESIMQGTIKPNRIILWLSEEEFKGKRLPHALRLQEQRGLQIEYCEDLLSYKKLIPTLSLYPNSCIITIDDDVIYDPHFLSNMMIAHDEYPNAICAGRVYRIKLDGNNMPKSYTSWQNLIKDYDSSRLNFFTGVGGVLYPVGCLDKEVMSKEVFMDICRHGDDIWFYAMAVLNNTPIVKCFSHNSEGDFITYDFVQEEALAVKNTSRTECRNDKQLKAVFEKYNLGEIISSQIK